MNVQPVSISRLSLSSTLESVDEKEKLSTTDVGVGTESSSSASILLGEGRGSSTSTAMDKGEEMSKDWRPLDGENFGMWFKRGLHNNKQAFQGFTDSAMGGALKCIPKPPKPNPNPKAHS